LHDLYSLGEFKNEISQMDGFGEKSCDNLLRAIETSRRTQLHRLLYGLGIPGFGSANCKLAARTFDTPEKILSANVEELLTIDGVGEVLARDFVAYFADSANRDEFLKLSDILEIEKPLETEGQVLAGKIFVITGSLNGYESRSDLKEYIESLGGKVSGSVSKNTSYLINNDAESKSSKNKKAKELGVEIITEDEFSNLVIRGELM